ncbi:DUF2165 family protein [Variovorax sp. OV329]|uniref:DUF2165 family protein n=1 Tax=Variovorax sp. OV329 TaxID=1882825 RepID=UPI000B87FF4B|nr:DUF2165 family protein [Variovorax sp. OV329]
MSTLCLSGAARLFAARRHAAAFSAAKGLAAWSLGLAFLLDFVAFLVIGGEWSCMWQSTSPFPAMRRRPKAPST